jgi:hypothetical protein
MIKLHDVNDILDSVYIHPNHLMMIKKRSGGGSIVVTPLGPVAVMEEPKVILEMYNDYYGKAT